MYLQMGNQKNKWVPKAKWIKIDLECKARKHEVLAAKRAK